MAGYSEGVLVPEQQDEPADYVTQNTPPPAPVAEPPPQVASPVMTAEQWAAKPQAPDPTYGRDFGPGGSRVPLPPQTDSEAAPEKKPATQPLVAERPVGLNDIVGAMGGMKPPPMPGTDNSAANAIMGFTNQGIKAETDLGDAEANKALAQGNMMSKQTQDAADEWEGIVKNEAANRAMVDKMAQDVASSKIDPNHYMSSRSAGQKISNIIGLILGGIGGGMTHSENPALAILNQKIQQDIDAQKSNLETKKGLLRHYMDQGHDLATSARLTFATHQQIRSAQLAAEASKLDNPVLKAQALKTAAELGRGGAAAMQEAQTRAIMQAKAKYDMLMERQNYAQAQLGRVVGSVADTGRPMGQDAYQYMDHSRTVQTPEGYRHATSPEAKKRIEEAQVLANKFQTALNNFKDLREQYSGGKLLPDAANEKGKIAAAAVQQAYEQLQGHTRAASGDEKGVLDSIVSNPLKFLTTDAKVKGAAEALQDMKDGMLNSVYQTDLMGRKGTSL